MGLLRAGVQTQPQTPFRVVVILTSPNPTQSGPGCLTEDGNKVLNYTTTGTEFGGALPRAATGGLFAVPVQV